VIVVADGMSACRAVIERLFLEAPNVKRYDTHFVFEPVKVGLGIPLRSARRGRE
jgi:DNA-binding Lrp family transcriptional regulator